MKSGPSRHRGLLISAIAVTAVLHAFLFAFPSIRSASVHPETGTNISYAPEKGTAPGITGERTSGVAGRTGTVRPAATSTGGDRLAGNRGNQGNNTSRAESVTGTGSRAGSAAEVRSAFLQKIESIKTYPPLARSAGMEGSVRFRVILDEHGNLTSLTTLATSGYWILDEAATKLVRSALPFPHHMPSFTCEFSIAYRLSEKK